MNSTLTTKKATELEVGDVVRTDGMRLVVRRVDDVSRYFGGEAGTTISAKCELLNRSEVPNDLVPTAWLRDEGSKIGVEFGWTIQGNALRTVAVES